MPRFLLKLFIVCAWLAPASGRAWSSSFAPPDGSGGVLRPVVSVSGRNFQLPDYSYTGYKLSQVGLGDGLPCYSVTLTAANNSDITSLLAAAVTTVANAGGGTVYLPAGTFQLSSTVWIKYSNLRIAGAGSASTTLVETSAYNPTSDYYESPLSFNAEGTPWTPLWMQESQATAATSSSDIPRGGLTLTAGSTAGFAAGDWVVVQQLFWPNLSEWAGAFQWTTTYASSSDWQFSLTYVRKIAGIAGSVITLDAPVPHALANANRAVRLFKPKAQYYIENVGLEGVSIQVQANSNNDGSDAGRPAGIGVNFKSAFNAWCRDVAISNIAKHGFQPCWSARVSFLDCSVNGAQDIGGGGFGYGYDSYCSQEVLFKRCSATNTRHGFTNEYTMATDLVMSQCQTLKPVGVNTPNSDVDDTHFAYAQQVLWDQHYQQNTGIQAMNRGQRSGAQTQETFASGAVWNYNNDGETLNWQADRVQLSPATYTAENDALIIGVTNASVYDGTEDPNPTTTGTLMSGAALQRGPRGNTAYEGLGQAGLSPASLFDAQLFTRMGHGMPPEIAPSACGGTPTTTPTRTGTRTATASATASPSPSSTATASGTHTASPSTTPSGSATVTQSRTVTPSLSPTPSASPSLTDSPTDVPPGSTATVTPSLSLTATLSFSPTIPDSPTPSASPSPTSTDSALATLTQTPAPSDSPSPSAQSSGSSTATLGATPPSSATSTPSATPSWTPGPALSANAAGNGSLQVLACLPVPNPDPLGIAVDLNGPADQVELRLYSPGMTLLAKLVSGPLASGWSRLALPADWAAAAPHGLSYVSIQARRGAEHSLPFAPVRLYRLR